MFKTWIYIQKRDVDKPKAKSFRLFWNWEHMKEKKESALCMWSLNSNMGRIKHSGTAWIAGELQGMGTTSSDKTDREEMRWRGCYPSQEETAQK